MKKILISFLACFSISSAFAKTFKTEAISVGKVQINSIKSDGNSYSSITVNSVGVTTKSNNTLFPVNGIVTFTCVGTNKTVNGSSMVDGNCVTKDADGDQYESQLKREGVVGEPSTPGTAIVKGISGKYVGLTGKCSYEVNFMRTADGMQNVSFQRCEYKK